MPSQDTTKKTRRFVFVLMPEFTLLSFAGALDALRLVNRQLGFPAYEWRLIGEGGGTATCSAGSSFSLDGDLEELRHDDTILLCSGTNVTRHTSPKLISWLRREARRGVTVAGLCTAAYALAKAGLLDQKRATIHWENHDGFLEDFPEVDLTKSIYVIDGKIITTAGGTASMDLMLTLISRDVGADVANAVADQQIYTSIRTDRDSQRLSVPTRIGVRHPKLATVIQKMETHIEDPISPATLANEVGLSTRQLERLFRRYLNRSPKRYYMELRLGRARNLLMQTEMNVINVALACGFTSPSHFSKCYRAQYGTTPYRERGSHAGADPAG
ncbi:GlxA family transcriptional regulator [Maritimibacter sp. UBA3975]|uniref:GlxA family transcriptional regulator n=1 Tax=Maritimibacter sp. UBA3975 TaxID=1946833 RepID=UPI000C08E584|nr:GlxA family transcriptional regulator [Maritimibacter sp. UBA3975]MAM60627.1 AraC family transcriptional regulator [Maritimibacter sp.]|tara:strand:- start:624 stop:1610 length:987 start_codon:yes stop_codon:yes gene_type:complete